jgi:hypothetical protein
MGLVHTQGFLGLLKERGSTALSSWWHTMLFMHLEAKYVVFPAQGKQQPIFFTIMQAMYGFPIENFECFPQSLF